MKRTRSPTSPGDLAEPPMLQGRDRELMVETVGKENAPANWEDPSGIIERYY